MASNGKYGNQVKKGLTYFIDSPFLVFLVIVFSCWALNNPKHQDAIWLGPYFSGAANLDRDYKNWRVDFELIDEFDETDPIEQDSFRFSSSSSDNLVPYNYNSVGYLYVSWISRNIFFWTGDIKAVEWVQILIHAALSLIVIRLYKEYVSKYVLLLLYAVNPLIIYFVTFPYGFFWTVLPSFFFILLYKKREAPSWLLLFVIPILLGLSFSVRSTTLFFLLFMYAWMFFKFRKPLIVMSFLLTILFTFLFNSFSHQKNPWFTMYVGLGAYPNEYVHQLSDNEGYKLFKNETGTKLTFSKNGNYYQESIQDQFHSIF